MRDNVKKNASFLSYAIDYKTELFLLAIYYSSSFYNWYFDVLLNIKSFIEKYNYINYIMPIDNWILNNSKQGQLIKLASHFINNYSSACKYSIQLQLSLKCFNILSRLSNKKCVLWKTHSRSFNICYNVKVVYDIQRVSLKKLTDAKGINKEMRSKNKEKVGMLTK